MSVLVVEDLTYSAKNKVLYNNSGFVLNKEDHMGIVGLNGTGKSTLINIIINKTEPTTGKITWQKGIKIGYLDQHAEVDGNLTILEFLRNSFKHLYDLEKQLNDVYTKMASEMSEELSESAEKIQNQLMYAGFYEIDERAHKVASGLGINVFGMDSKLSQLSGGQRAKVILGKLLLENPDVLLMDEPTNFLDKQHVDWLCKFLNSFEGAFIIISHDFSFLNRVTNCILDIEFQTLKKYTGNFDQFLNLKEEHKKNYISEFEKQQKTMSHLQEYYDRWHAGTKAKSAQSRLKQLEKIKEDALTPPKSVDKPTFHFTAIPIIPGNILTTTNLSIGYNKPLLPPINFNLNGQQKVVITGFNGIGKSTFIKTILGIIKPLGGEYKWQESVRIGYFDQELTWVDKTKNAFEILKDAFPNMEDLAIRKALAQCAIKGKHSMQPVHTLSGGEQVKVKMCLLMLEKNNVLILDEPTNHIDVDTKEVLKEELIKWTGSLLLITHEHDFFTGWIENVVNIKS